MGRRLQATRTQTRRRADKSVNDQGEIFDDFLSETPTPVEFEEGEDDGADAPNGSGADRVKDAQRRRARARRVQQRTRARRANETKVKGEDGRVAEPDCREDLENEVSSPKRTDPQVAARKSRVAQRHFQGARQWASRQGVKLTVGSSKDLFDWATLGYAHEAKLNKESTRRAVAFRVAQLKKMAESPVGLKGEAPAIAEDVVIDEAPLDAVPATAPEAPSLAPAELENEFDDGLDVRGPVARRRAHRRKAGYKEMSDFNPNKRAFMSRKRRRANDTNLDVAAPNGRTDIESPVRNTTDDYAQDSQYVEEEYADNASDDKAKPDLTTDQNWTPGEGKKSSRRKTSGAEAARYTDALLKAGHITEAEKWATMDQAERMSRAVVRDRTALLERTNAKWAEKLSSAQPARTARKSRSVIPQNLGAPSQVRQSAVSNDHESDSLMFL